MELNPSSIDVYYKCNICGLRWSGFKNITRHMEVKHIITRYPCDLCDFKAAKESELHNHRSSFHRVRNVRNIMTHIGVKHIIPRNLCDLCNFEATEQSGLHQHRLSFHRVRNLSTKTSEVGKVRT